MTALEKVAIDNRDLLHKYRIEIHTDERMILYRDLAIPVPFGTTTYEIMRVVNKMVRSEKAILAEQEAEARKRNQANLF